MPFLTPSTPNPYADLPSSPNAFDDEFNSGSPDLATRGYTVINAVSGATLTRAGDVAPWDGTGPVGNTYWSTLRGSWLFLQAAAGIQIDFYKAITLSAGDTYYARMGGSYHAATAANGRYNEIGFYGISAGLIDNNNRVYSTVRDDTSTTSFMIYDLARYTAGVSGGPAVARQHLGHYDIRGVRFASGTTHYAFMVSSNGGEVLTTSLTTTPASSALTVFGLRNLFSSSGSAVPQVWAIDFIRKKTSNAWLIP